MRLSPAPYLFLVVLTCSAACSKPDPTPPIIFPPVPTEIEFTPPDLEPVFATRRLLPPGATAVELSTIPHPSFSELPESQYFISAVYSNGAEFAGRVSVFMYTHPEELDSAWPRLLDQIVTPKEISGLGELAAIDHSDLAFIRCSALVHIKLVYSDSFELRTFAEALEAKMAPVVCSLG